MLPRLGVVDRAADAAGPGKRRGSQPEGGVEGQVKFPSRGEVDMGILRGHHRTPPHKLFIIAV